jgi:alkanesulfonate monooxygenase SsuD/methylene tetrahydromethanopterin reductase-like flavin-dependent oxidoreductase (luciferase family)
LDGQTVSYTGPGFTVQDVHLDFTPPSTTPIYLASRNPAMLALAGEIADGAIIESLPSPDGIGYARDRLRLGAQRTGRDVSELPVVSWQMLFLDDDPAITGRPDVLQWATAVISSTRPSVLQTLGIDPDWSRDVALPEEAAKIFSIGSAVVVAQQVDTILATGVDTYIGVVLGDADTIRTTMRRFAHDVMPALDTKRNTP